MNKFERLVLLSLWVILRWLVYDGRLDGRDKVIMISTGLKIAQELGIEE